MKNITLKARAKINLTLDVLRKREDGYHDLKMIMQSVNLYDKIYIEKIDKKVIKLKTNISWLPTDEKNLAYKAAKVLFDRFDKDGNNGVFIEITKKIPVAAGLAGGSSDCAAVLIGINKLFGFGLSKKELMQIGFELGSDVPFCILRQTSLAEGRGEILTPIKNNLKCKVVLAKLPVSVSTGMVFSKIKVDEIEKRPDTQNMISYIKEGNLNAICKGLVNVLENVTIPMYPKIDSIKRTMMDFGALGSLMSGSGPAVFGIFDDEKKAEDAADYIKNTMNIKETFVTDFF